MSALKKIFKIEIIIKIQTNYLIKKNFVRKFEVSGLETGSPTVRPAFREKPVENFGRRLREVKKFVQIS